MRAPAGHGLDGFSFPCYQGFFAELPWKWAITPCPKKQRKGVKRVKTLEGHLKGNKLVSLCLNCLNVASREIACRSACLLPWPMVMNQPPREVAFPIRPHGVSVGLFAAAILCNLAGLDRTEQISHKRSGSAGRSVCQNDKASRYAFNAVNLLLPMGLVNRFSRGNLFCCQSPHFRSGLE